MRNERQIYKYKMRTNSDKFPLIPLGDVHFGQESCDYKKFYKYLDWIDDHDDARVILMGDMAETDIPSHMTNAGVMWGQEISPSEQMDEIYELLKPLKRKIIGGVMGNHEKRIWVRTSFCPTKILCDKLNAMFIHPNPSYLDIDVGKFTYRCLVAHGSGSSQRGDYQLRKAVNYYPSSDLIMIGHIHQINSEPYHKLIVDDGTEKIKTIYGVRTGGFLFYPPYARERFMEPVDTGAPIVYLYTNNRIISVNTSDFVGLQ